MTDVYQSYNLFVSSPSDVAAERQFAESTVYQINRMVLDTLKLSINIKKWENMPPQIPHLPEETIQDILNKEVEKSNFFLLILYKRYGTIEPGYSISNTERELNTILEAYERKPSLKILCYFRNLKPNTDPGEQEQKVRSFRSRLEKMGILYKTYDTPENFKDLFTHDFYDTIFRMKLSSFKKDVLQKYWKFGELDRTGIPRLAIMYPPINRIYNDPINDKNFWLKRLEPNIYFEDHKALQKLRKMFSLIGFHDYRIYSSLNPPSELQFMNRVWICMPRCKRAIKQINEHKSARFTFLPGKNRRLTKLIWNHNKNNAFPITSPLTKYLEVQRETMDISGEWKPQMGKIIAKDFAVLTRLVNPNTQENEEGNLYDYSIAGIHGLGTWGAAWFLDRNYSFLKDNLNDVNIQLLLEVLYQDGRILDVKIVSEEKQSYFKKENSVHQIRKIINQYKELT